jgi:hypothetical protein
VITGATSDPEARQFNPAPPVLTTTPEVDVDGGGVGAGALPVIER